MIAYLCSASRQPLSSAFRKQNKNRLRSRRFLDECDRVFRIEGGVSYTHEGDRYRDAHEIVIV